MRKNALTAHQVAPRSCPRGRVDGPSQQRTNASPPISRQFSGRGKPWRSSWPYIFLFDILGRAHGWRQPHGCSPVMRRSRLAVDGCGQCRWTGSGGTIQIAGERPLAVPQRRASAQTRVIFASAAVKVRGAPDINGVTSLMLVVRALEGF